MTFEERAQKMKEFREAAETKCTVYNSAIMNEDLKAANAVVSDIEEAVSEYNKLAQIDCFEHLKQSENPMLEAVKQLTYDTIAVKDEKVGEDTKVTVRKIEDREKQIDLLKLDKYCGGIGNDSNWKYAIEKLNLLMTCKVAESMGINPTGIHDSYQMSKYAKEYDLGKNPASNTKLLATLQTIVEMMIGPSRVEHDADGGEIQISHKAVSHDVAFLNNIYGRKSRKALTVTCSNHRFMRGYIMEICHRIVTGKAYNVDYKKEKSKA